MEAEKSQFIKALTKAGGIIATACEMVRIPRSRYTRWYKTDEEFREAVDEVMETQCDFVESCLMEQVRGGNTTSTIFYLKCKGKKRGWIDKPVQTPDPVAREQPVMLEDKAGVLAAITERLTDAVRGAGKDPVLFAAQIDVVAGLLVRAKELSAQLDATGSVKVEISREGNRRESLDPRYNALLDTMKLVQSGLRALGLNADTKNIESGEDTFMDRLEELKGGD